MTNMDVLLILGIVAFLAMYAAWMWDEVKIAVPEENEAVSQNEAQQSHETTSNEETPSSETKTQQEARK